MGKNITVYDIANEAGVSVATVSRVLNDNSKVAEITRQRVQGIIDKYNFKPNELARSLYKSETKMIGCILPDISNPYYSSVFTQAESYAIDLDYTLVLCNARDQQNNDSLYLQTLIERQVDGIIYMGRNANKSSALDNFDKLVSIYKERLPIVMINWRNENSGAFHITSDESQGFWLVIEEVVKQGHKKVALLGGKSGVQPTDLKRTIYQEAIQKYGLYDCNDYIVDGDYTVESGFHGMNRLLDSEERPTAVLGVNDMIAIGALKACHKRGIKVPEDIAVTGFDNVPMSQFVYPSLTTVAHNYEKLGKKAVDLIVNKGKYVEGTRCEYPMHLVKGESL